jgi:mannose-6-phosphate isomerase-like protein (cupin superfamily)
LPGQGSSLAPATWALVDLSLSGCSPMLAPMPVATGSPPSAESSASCAGLPNHSFSLPRMPTMRRVYDHPNAYSMKRCGRQCRAAPQAEDENAFLGRRSRNDTYDCAVPFTLRNIKEDLEDIGPRFDGAPDLEFRAATKALELEKSALSYQRVPPGYRFPYGHSHTKQEEVYVVLRGSGRMKVDDEIVELKEWDAVRVPPGMWRGYEAGPEGLEILVIGAPNLGEDPREDVDGQRDWWAN